MALPQLMMQTFQTFYPHLPDHSIPIRFLFILLNNPDSRYIEEETINVGRAMGALLSDEVVTHSRCLSFNYNVQVFQQVAYNCSEKFTLADAVDEFISQVLKTTRSANRCLDCFNPSNEGFCIFAMQNERLGS